MPLIDIFLKFLSLGFISFGGPAAHIGYFQKTFVEKHQWLSQEAYGKMIALSQFLPGPGSSQVGFGIGCMRAGLLGGICAFIGFTLPSFLLMYGISVLSLSGSWEGWMGSLISGLKLLAVVVVLDAVLNMFQKFCTSTLKIAICVMAASLILSYPSITMQMIALIIASLIGGFFLKEKRKDESLDVDNAQLKWVPIVFFFLILFGLPFIDHQLKYGEMFSQFYQAGSFVFGGGHVVLPLLQHTVGEQLADDQFLLGYAAAQGIPGPMFTLATYLGAECLPENALLGALIGTGGIFLPGFLLMYGLLGAWGRLTAYPILSGVSIGINAAVVGLLISALYQPVFTSAIHDGRDLAFVVLGFFLLKVLKTPIIVMVLGAISIGFLAY